MAIEWWPAENGKAAKSWRCAWFDGPKKFYHLILPVLRSHYPDIIKS